MAENNRGGRPPRRNGSSDRGNDTGPRDRGNRQPSQGNQERTRQTKETPPQTGAQEGAAKQPGSRARRKQAQRGEQPPVSQAAREEQGAPSAEESVEREASHAQVERGAGEVPERAEVAAGAESAGESGEAGEGLRRERHRGSLNNALGMLIERHFEDPTSPCRSYSDLERRSHISREALSRYVTTRPDRRRSPTIDSLVAIADAMHLGFESVARAAAAAAKGIVPPPEEVQQRREDLVRTSIAALSDEQFSAVVELLIQMRPLGPGSSGSRRPIPQF